jgi:hypothetical protein
MLMPPTQNVEFVIKLIDNISIKVCRADRRDGLGEQSSEGTSYPGSTEHGSTSSERECGTVVASGGLGSADGRSGERGCRLVAGARPFGLSGRGRASWNGLGQAKPSVSRWRPKHGPTVWPARPEHY